MSREHIAASGPRRLATGTKIGFHIQVSDIEMTQVPGALERFREQAVAGLRITGVREGLVLDDQSVVFEGTSESMFGPGGMMRYTAYAYPHGAVPPADDVITGWPDHYIVNGDASSCGCAEHA